MPRTYTGDDFRDALRGAAVIANHSASIIRDLTAALVAARPYVATCADDELPNGAAEALALIDRALKTAQVRNGQP